MIRLMLCILIIFCGAVIGLHFSRRLTKRREILLSFEKLFHRAQLQIGYNAGDLCEAFGENFASFPFCRSQPFDVQWERLIKQFTYHLTKDDISMLSEFTRGLGTADAEAQQKHIALYVELLQEHIRSAQEDIRNKTKVARIIPTAIGMAIALMMI